MTGVGGLLETVPRRESAHAALLTDILDFVHGLPRANAAAPSSTAQELSPTELRVLRYLPTNLSRTEIAGELSVSVNTVARHVRNIYAELQVSGRSSAVRRARELQLLAAAPIARPGNTNSPDCDDARLRSVRGALLRFGGTLFEEGSLGGVAGQLGGSGEFGLRLVEAAELGEQVAADGGQ